jgi:hypothetical protein
MLYCLDPVPDSPQGGRVKSHPQLQKVVSDGKEGAEVKDRVGGGGLGDWGSHKCF